MGRSGIRGTPPREHFTRDRVLSRRDLPKVLFHWTRSLESALAVISDGYLRGRPTISTSENPAFGTPGPVVFVLAPKAILARGFKLLPFLWNPGYEQEAEWVVAAGDAEQDSGLIFSSRVELPLRGVVRLVGYTPGWGHPRFHDRVRALRAAARTRNLPVRAFDWTRWWDGGAVVARNPGRRR